ncbi:MAG TPA: ABC transporter permease [Planctomycetota bacterium]|nr:ABC transporter permease [Planctomycetota bacterium]
MATYVLRRLLWMVPTLLGITLLLFVVMSLAPGDPATVRFGAQMSGGAGTQGVDVESAIQKFRAKYHLDEPIPVQYWHWLVNLVQLDFGTEFSRPNVEVMDEVWRRIQITLPLALLSTLLSYLIALPLGIFSAVRQRSAVDKLVTLLLFVLYSLPTFWVGLMLILIFGKTGFDLLPVIGLHDKDASQLSGWPYYRDLLLHLVLPVATLTYGGLAYLSRQMRVGMLDTIRQDYVRTARAKGLPERTVVLRHALRNALIPVITVFANILPILISGSLIVEAVFGIPGMGLYAFEGLQKRDYPVVLATTTLSAVMTMLGILLSDLLYAVVDPRISYD